MEADIQDPDFETNHLRACINDLITVVALPSIYSGGEPSQIVPMFLDVLLGMLRLDFVFARLRNPGGDAPADVVRIAQWRKMEVQPGKLTEVFLRALGDDPCKWPALALDPFGDGDISMVPLRVGLRGEIGLIVAGSQRADFPTQTERLLLSVAVNQVAIGLHEARLLNEQKRLTNELDRQVMERTAELAISNDTLKKEIAERQLTEAALNKLQSEMAHVTRVMTMSELASSIAHEINQPLGAIVNYGNASLRLLNAGPEHLEDIKHAIAKVVGNANRASGIIAQIRALSKKAPPEKVTLRVRQLIDEVMALTRHELDARGITFHVQCGENLPPVSGDRVQIQQLLLNLVMNGIEAMISVAAEDRALTVYADRQEADGQRRVLIRVQDAGVGLRQEDMSRLFEAFYTTKPNGLGMGLAISRSIVEAHGGKLWAEPNEGPGAAFCVALPAEAQRET